MYDHWVEPGFPYNVGKFLIEYFFQELHASGQSVVLKTIFINVSYHILVASLTLMALF